MSKLRPFWNSKWNEPQCKIEHEIRLFPDMRKKLEDFILDLAVYFLPVENSGYSVDE